MYIVVLFSFPKKRRTSEDIAYATPERRNAAVAVAENEYDKQASVESEVISAVCLHTELI